MSLNRRNYLILLLAALSLLAFFGYDQKPSFCEGDEPIGYRLETLDSRFGIDREAFEEALLGAESIWERELGLNLFELSEEGDLVVEAAYGTEQKDLEQLEGYNSGVDEFNQEVAAYDAAAAEYQSRVSYWNDRGGAPEGVYEDLNQRKAELDRWFSDLENDSRYLEAIEPEGEGEVYYQGLYEHDGYDRRITINSFSNMDDLVTVLAHEMGHALGIEHVEGSDSLMYELFEADSYIDELSESDKQAFYEVCSD